MDRSREHKVFIPLTLDASTKSAMGNKQFLGIAAAVVVVVFLQVGLLIFYVENAGFNFFANGFILLPLDIAIVYGIVWLLRKVIFNEEELLKAYEANKTNEVTDLSFVWDIFDIDNDKIYYVNGYVGAVVQLEHGYIYDRPKNHSDIHRECIKRAVGGLTRKGYWFRYYNREVKDTNLYPLYKTERLLEKERGSTFYSLETDILNHVKKVCESIASTEVETYLIIAPDMNSIQALDATVEEFINHMHGGLFTFIYNLDTEDLYEMICDFYDLQSIDIDKILKKKYRYTDIDVVSVKDVIYDDSYVEEENIISDESNSEVEDYERMLRTLAEDEDGEDEYL